MVSQFDQPDANPEAGSAPPAAQQQPYVATITAASPPTERITPNTAWLKQLPDGGILHGILILFGIITMSCAASFDVYDPCFVHGPARSWFLFVSATAWISTLLLSLAYFMNANNIYRFIPITELVANGVWSLLYFIAVIVQGSLNAYCSPYVASVVFGVFLFLLYGVATFFAYRRYRALQQYQN